MLEKKHESITVKDHEQRRQDQQNHTWQATSLRHQNHYSLVLSQSSTSITRSFT
jgi:hypothetical protein